MKDNIVEIAKNYAIKSHRDCNQLYANSMTYDYHLKMAVEVGNDFLWLIPGLDADDVIAGIWCHDIIEDARQTYNDVLKNTNETVAEYAYALTNEKGRNRKERANDKYYEGIRNYKHATFIKLCDRIANVRYSSTDKTKMFEMYKKEQEEFKQKLYDGRYDALWYALKLFFE